jgi:hypothetical protein
VDAQDLLALGRLRLKTNRPSPASITRARRSSWNARSPRRMRSVGRSVEHNNS